MKTLYTFEGLWKQHFVIIWVSNIIWRTISYFTLLYNILVYDKKGVRGYQKDVSNLKDSAK